MGNNVHAWNDQYFFSRKHYNDANSTPDSSTLFFMHRVLFGAEYMWGGG